MGVIKERADDTQNQYLRQRPLLIDGIHHLDVEGGRLVKSPRGVVKQDVCVLEEPGGNEQRQRDADETSFSGNEEQESEDNDYRYGSATQRAY